VAVSEYWQIEAEDQSRDELDSATEKWHYPVHFPRESDAEYALKGEMDDLINTQGAVIGDDLELLLINGIARRYKIVHIHKETS
jgi:hypothetical protein